MDLDAEIVSHLKNKAVKVPPFPAVVMKLKRLIADPAHNHAQVVEAVKADAVLAGSVLRVANSAFHRRGDALTTLHAAVQRIGEKELGRLALAASMSEQALAVGPLGRLRRKVWHDSVTAAAVCELLAPLLKLDLEELFVAGLLHDVGCLVALNTIEDILKEHPEEPARSAFEWWKIIDRYHIELGIVLAAKWDLPDVHRDCISQHHGFAAGDFTRQIGAMVAADKIVELLNTGTHVTADMLSSVVLFESADDLTKLAEQIPGLSSLVASFEDDKPPRSTVLSKVLLEKLPPLARMVQPFKMKLKSGLQTECRAANANRVVFTSPSAMPDNFLQELHIDAKQGQFPLWVSVTRCTAEPDGKGFEIEARPFALSGPALRQWINVSAELKAA